jgi:hypothetical protein
MSRFFIPKIWSPYTSDKGADIYQAFLSVVNKFGGYENVCA